METSDLEISECSSDFAFGFDDPKYSDRILQLEIIDASRVKTIHISSLILAAKSLYFRKMFSNGMQESEQKSVTLRINTSEEASLMNLLKYIYSTDLPTTLNALLDLLVITDKFVVVSCLRDCARALQNLPMTCTLASIYLDLPPNLLMSPLVEPLVVAAKQFLVTKFKDLDKFEVVVEMLNLSLLGIQVILSSDELQVISEHRVFKFVLAWVRKHYPNLKERREILKADLLHLVRFPFMTTRQLTEEVQTCEDIDPEVSSKIVIHALGFKAETPHRKRCLAAKEASRQFVERDYKLWPIKVVEHALPHPQCIVYLDLTKERLIRIFPKGGRASRLYLGEQELFLFWRCYTSSNNTSYFWLSLGVLGSISWTVNYDIQLRMNPSGEFMNWEKGNHMFTESTKIKKFKHVLWTEFIDDNGSYFVNNVLHVRATLTIKND